MDPVGLLITILIGAVAGFLAGKIMRGRGFGLAGNIVVGVIGAFIGNFLFGLVPLALPLPGIVMEILVATIGAIILLALINWLQKQ